MAIYGGTLNASSASKLLAAPDLLVHLTRAFARKSVRAQFDQRFRSGTSGAIARVDIKITNSCNLRCEMCGQWGDNGWHLHQQPSFMADVLTLDDYKKLIDDVTPLKPWIAIWGGEPFLSPSLIPLLGHIKKAGLPVTLNTNGTLLEPHCEEIVRMGVDFLLVSIDGGRHTHEQVRRVAGAFDKTMAGMQAIQVEKQKQRRVRPFLILSATVTTQNAGCFEEVFEVAEQAHADGLGATYGWFQTAESCQRHEQVMAAQLGTFAFSQRGFVRKVDPRETAEAVVESVRRITSRRWPFPYQFIPNLSLEEIPRYFEDHSCRFGHDRCIVPWSVAGILPNGDVTTCSDYPDYIVGNIRNAGIRDIWNNDRYRKFRICLQDKGLLPVCSRCCGLLADS